MNGFDAAIKKFSSRALERVRRTRSSFAESFIKAVAEKTPVDSGLLKANWQAACRTPPQGVVGPREASAVAAEAAQAAGPLGDGDGDIFVVNNLPYAGVVEYGLSENGGAPAGMLRGALAEAPALLNKAAGKAKSL